VERKRALPTRSEALTLLATLQREARLVDFLSESLEGYSDAQIGAAVRDIHRGCRQTLERIFGLRPIASGTEGTSIELDRDYDPARYRVLGEPADTGAITGRLVHRGWEATKCELPTWSGSVEAAMVIAPAEVELAHGSWPRAGEGLPLPGGAPQ